MKSYSAIIALLFACVLAFVWAAPAEVEVATDAVASISAKDQAVLDWYNSVYPQYDQAENALVARDVVPVHVAPYYPPSSNYPPYPPPPTFPPYPPPPTFPPYPPTYGGGRHH